MIINKSNYFKGEIYVAHANSSITDDVVEIGNELDDFINERSEECLLECLGLVLFLEFKSKLNAENENGLDNGVEDKWNHLLNGLPTYVNPKGKTVRWKGIRYKSINATDAPYDKSFLANYVYFFYESNKFISTTGIGQNIPKAKNAEVVNPSFKAIKAWRKFHKMVVGDNSITVINKDIGYGLDFYGNSGQDVSLYKFIEDMNNLNGDNYYADFNPKNWGNINQYQI